MSAKSDARASYLTGYLLGMCIVLWMAEERDGSGLWPEMISDFEDKIRELGALAGAEVDDDHE